jgi:hypothetical protein
MSNWYMDAVDYTSDFWNALEGSGPGYEEDVREKLADVSGLKKTMEKKSAKLLADISDWALHFEHWHTLETCTGCLNGLYSLREGFIEMDRFEGLLAESPEWMELWERMAEAA